MERAALNGDGIKTMDAFIQKAIRQVNKLTELIKDLLDVTKIQSGKLIIKKTEFLLDELITECTEELQSSSQKHQLIIEGETGITIYGDRTRLEQVIINLLANAIKYSPNADKVVINVEKLDEGVKVAITDFGIGIPADKIPLIFDRFYRIDENSQRYAGLGLGLFISSEIISQHNGRINIESKEGAGSTFWFIIPAN